MRVGAHSTSSASSTAILVYYNSKLLWRVLDNVPPIPPYKSCSKLTHMKPTIRTYLDFPSEVDDM